MEYVRYVLVRNNTLRGYRIQEEHYDDHKHEIPEPGIVRESSMDIYMPFQDGCYKEGRRRLLQAYSDCLRGEIARLEKIASAVALDIGRLAKG